LCETKGVHSPSNLTLSVVWNKRGLCPIWLQVLCEPWKVSTQFGYKI
jgi:hypothetical protein